MQAKYCKYSNFYKMLNIQRKHSELANNRFQGCFNCFDQVWRLIFWRNFDKICKHFFSLKKMKDLDAWATTAIYEVFKSVIIFLWKLYLISKNWFQNVGKYIGLDVHFKISEVLNEIEPNFGKTSGKLFKKKLLKSF